VFFIGVAGCTGNQQPPGSPATTYLPTTGNLPPAGIVAVTIRESAFDPAIITVPRGTKVTWENQDAIDHQVINDAIGQTGEGALFKSNLLPTGGVFSFTFIQPGTYPYHCNIHPFMTGSITVT
jgi:plastocyanin